MDDNHREKVEVGYSPKLFEQVLGEESKQRIFGGPYIVVGISSCEIGWRVVERNYIGIPW